MYNLLVKQIDVLNKRAIVAVDRSPVYVDQSCSVEGNDLNHLVEGNQAGLFRSIVFERITRPYPLPTTYKHFLHKPLWFQTRRFFMFSLDGPLQNMYPPGGLILCPRVKILKYLEEVKKVMLHNRYQGSWLFGFKENIFLFPYIILHKHVTPGWDHFWPRGII